MQGVVFLGSRRAEVREFPDPHPGPGQVRVRIRAAAVCGSDMHKFRHEGPAAEPLVIPGHEPAGVIDELGDGVTALSVADRVLVHMAQGCGACEWCRRGDYKYCTVNHRGLGWHVNGSMADYVIADARSCFVMPTTMSFVEGMLYTCLIGTVYRIGREVGLSGIDIVAIYGLGPVGLAGVMVARAMGATVIGIDPIVERRTIATDLGAHTTIDPLATDSVAAIRELTAGLGADVGIDYSGNGTAQRQVLESVCRYGRVGLVGVNEQPLTFDPEVILYNQLRVSGSYTYSVTDIPPMLRFAARHELALERLVTHRFALADARAALELFDGGRTGKVVLLGGES